MTYLKFKPDEIEEAFLYRYQDKQCYILRCKNETQWHALTTYGESDYNAKSYLQLIYILSGWFAKIYWPPVSQETLPPRVWEVKPSLIPTEFLEGTVPF
jgi:hypothetical protein